MKKILIVVSVIVVAGLVGGGIYLTTKKTDAKQVNLSLVMSNLKKKYPAVEETYIYSKDRDPNDNLGKEGYYTTGAEFYDTRTDTKPDGKAFGADSGGAIEVYSNSSNAAKRVSYLKSFQGNSFLDPGAFKQVNNVVVRASSKYSPNDQANMINYLASSVQQN